MALNGRQLKAYRSLCNIWTVTRTINAGTGVVGSETWSLAYSGVQCHYEYTPNVDDVVDAAGRVKRATILTEDIVHFDAAQIVNDGDILKDVTILPDGSQSPNYGQFHRVHGDSRITPNAGARRANKRSVMAMTIEKPPNGVS